VIDNLPSVTKEPLASILRKVEEAGLTEHEELYPAAVVVFAALIIGTDEHRIAAETGLQAELVSEMAERLRRNGLWCGDKVVYRDWNHPDELRAEINLTLDLMVANGDIVRTGRVRDGQFEYTLSQETRRKMRRRG
jgi:hypothetical protein